MEKILSFKNNFWQKTVLQNIFLVLAHLLFFFIVFSIIREWQGKPLLPGSSELSLWDAAWYKSIIEKGYSFHLTEQSNAAFFPAFPYFWKLLGLSVKGISLLNILLFLFSSIALFQFFPANWKWKLIFLSNPSICFFFIPYTESLFFFFITLFLIGLKKERLTLSVTGLFLACLTRASVLVFIPAFIIMMVYYQDKKKAKHFLAYLLTIAVGILTVSFIEYYYTGIFFAFTKAQIHWGHKLGIPQFPLTSWGGSLPLFLDIGAFYGSSIAAIFMGIFFINRVNNRSLIPKEIILAFLYLAGIAGLLFFTQGGSLNSLNRYAFATPFMYIFLRELFAKDFPAWKYYILIVVLTLLYALLFFNWRSGSEAKYLLFLMLYILSFYLLLLRGKLQTLLFWLLLIINIFIQAYTAAYFFTNEWVG